MSPNTVVPEGMREFYESVEFVSGAGDGKTTFCIEQAVAYMAGEEVTDNPTCACPVIRRGAMRVNDSRVWSSNAERTAALKPLMLAQLGTRSTPEVERARGIMAVRFAVRIVAPFWLRKAGLVDEANALAALTVAPETLAVVHDRCRQARSRAYDDDAYAADARTLLTQYVGVLLAMCDVTPETAADVLANDRTEVADA